MSGAASHHGGAAAEEIVARHYARQGFAVVRRRWRGPGGEIDLVLRGPAGLVFVEVKAAADAARAAERIGPRQLARIRASAAAFLAGEPEGQDSAARLDVALVDGQGRVEIVENLID